MSVRLPAAPDFPVRWERPDDEGLFWTQDRQSCPDPLPPLEAAFLLQAYEDAFRRAADAYDLGLTVRPRLFNSYLYLAFSPLPAMSEDWSARERRPRAKLAAAADRLEELLRDSFLPEVQRILTDWGGFDLATASEPKLLGHLDRTLDHYKRLFEIHFLITFPCLLVPSAFEDFYRDLFSASGPFEPYCLLQGLDNETLRANRALWRLSREALGSPDVRRALEEPGTDEVFGALEGSAPGRVYLADLQAYLDQYGQIGDTRGLSAPSWIEDPTPVLKNLRDYVAQPERDLERELAAVAAQREEALAETRARLRREVHPPEVVERFECLLRQAQVATVLSEDHGHWIDVRGAFQVRRVLLEFGRRLARAGVLIEPDDVFFLTLDELRVTTAALPLLDRRALVEARRAELEHWRTVTPPSALGTLPEGPEPDVPLARALSNFSGPPPP